MSSFPIGCAVTLQNLVKGSQYNGKNGIVKTNYAADINGGRQNVMLKDDGNKIVAVKPQNMKLFRPDVSRSSKKKRGKQRKAAKKDRVPTGIILFIPQDGTTIVHPENKKYIVQLIQSGAGPVTEALIKHNIDVTNYSLVDSGVLSVVLAFLKRCEDESFTKVVTCLNGNAPENLQTPVAWIRILAKVHELEPSCRLEIVQNIGPLVRCMCNDTERLFFKSNVHWREGIEPFVSLIYNLLHKTVQQHIYQSNEDNENIISTLLDDEGLITRMVQWVFWEKEHRPDITRLLKMGDCEHIINLGGSFAELIVALSAQDDKVEKGMGKRKWSGIVGTTPIVCKEYDPNCMVSFVAGIIRQVNQQGKVFDMPQYGLLQLLVVESNCVDKGVITEMIRYGTNITAGSINDETDLVNAERVASLSYVMILHKSDSGLGLPCDTRISHSIRDGLIEMILIFVELFGEQASFSSEDDGPLSLFDSIKSIFYKIYCISLHKKTWKAIRHKKGIIETTLLRLKQNESITNNIKCRKLLDMIESILDTTGSYCCRCNKSLTRTEVKLCNGCNCMAYCSRSCQREDWLDGHKSCCKSFSEKLCQSIAPNERAASKFHSLEMNVTNIQLKLFLDNAETILRQAEALDLSLNDCVVLFDLRHCPPIVVVDKYTLELVSISGDGEDFEKSRSKDSIKTVCIYKSYCFSNGGLDAVGVTTSNEKDARGNPVVPLLTSQRFFAHERLHSSKDG